MANNYISWLGNPVVDGNMVNKPNRMATPYQPCEQQYQNQDLTNLLSVDAQNNMTAMPLTQGNMPVMPMTQEGPPPVTNIEYIPGYLANNIGKNVRAEFVIGTQYVDKTGKLVEVGVNYFVLQDVNSRTNIMCDLYSVKFVTILV